METSNRLTVTRGEKGGGEGKKEGEGSSVRTHINDPWTWTTGWGFTVGAGERARQGRAMGEIQTTVTEQ